VWRESNGPRPTTNERTAQATASDPPTPPRLWATDSCRCDSQPGSSVTAPLMAPETDPAARLAGSSHRIPLPTHTRAQMTLPPHSPSGPSEAADPDAAGRAARGHTSRPMAP
jgi:hypothetical protein